PLDTVPFRLSADRPAPHPFPTRRSSDLPAATIAASRPPNRRLARLRRTRLPTSAPVRTFEAAQDEGGVVSAEAERVRDGGADLGDRKSTRLNSSHEWISYAVFCLKKKNR